MAANSASSKKMAAELFGTAVLVYFACGVATLTFGKFHHPLPILGTGMSASAGIVATSLAFGLVLMGLIYAIGSISGCHVNPAVTIGALIAKRITLTDAIGYWIAQFIGGIVGAGLLWFTFKQSPNYISKSTGLGADGYGVHSMIHISAGGAFLAEVIMTAIFVFVILAATGKAGAGLVTGLVIGLTLTLVHLFGISVDGTSVNPARSFGPALLLGGDALKQVWVFIVAPLVGGAVAAVTYRFLHGTND